MNQKKFEKIYFGYTNRKAAKKLKIAPSTLVRYAKEFGLSKPLGRKKGSTKLKLIF